MSFCEILNLESDSKVIGKGSYSKVYLKNFQGKEVAVKSISIDVKTFYGDFDKQSKFTHPYILENYIVFTDLECQEKSLTNNRVYVVSELMSFTLNKLVKNNLLYKESRNKICYQLLKAIYFIHKHDIAHLDIKPENVLLRLSNNELETKLADFGGSVYMGDKNAVDSRVYYNVTRIYTPPEIIIALLNNSPKDIIFKKKNDIWAYGITAVQTLTSKPLFVKILEELNKKIYEYIYLNKILIDLPFINPLLDTMISDSVMLNTDYLPSAKDLLGFEPQEGKYNKIKIDASKIINHENNLDRLFLTLYNNHSLNYDVNIVFLAIHNLIRLSSKLDTIYDDQIEMLIITAGKSYGYKITYEIEKMLNAEMNIISHFQGRIMEENLLYYNNYDLMDIFDPVKYANFVNENEVAYNHIPYNTFADVIKNNSVFAEKFKKYNFYL